MIYFPMTCNIITAGHVKCLEHLAQYDFVTIGLLTSKALEGYKKEITPYVDRLYILEKIAKAIEDIDIVPQDTLDPSENIIMYRCKAIASGDGWEQEELQAIERLGIQRMDIKLRGETDKMYSSTKTLNNI